MHAFENSVPPVRMFRFLMSDNFLSAAEENFNSAVNYEYDEIVSESFVVIREHLACVANRMR